MNLEPILKIAKQKRRRKLDIAMPKRDNDYFEIVNSLEDLGFKIKTANSDHIWFEKPKKKKKRQRTRK